MKITKTELLQIIKEETEGEMQFKPLEDARKAYLQDPNDETKHQLGLMINKLVEPLMAEMGLFWEAEAYYNVGDLVFNNRQVDVTIDPKGAMGRYDVNVSPVVSAMDTDPAFKPMDITVPSMKGVVQFINDKVFKSSGMAGEPEAQTELPFGKGGLTKENKMKITKQQLQQVIREEITKTLNEEYSLDMEVFFETIMGLAQDMIKRTGMDGKALMDDLLAMQNRYGGTKPSETGVGDIDMSKMDI